MMMNLRRTVGMIAVSGLLVAGTLEAEQLSSKGWTVIGPEGEKVAQAADNNLETAWTSKKPQHTGMGLTIDLGRTAVVHRIYLNPGRQETCFPRSLRILAGPDSGNLEPVQEIRLTTDRETNLKFNPVTGRVFRLEIGKDACGLAWSVAELEVYGSFDPAARQPQDVVVVDPKAAEPLQLAARELRYHLGELSGRPLPIIAPDQTDKYPGTLYTIVDFAPLAKTYEEMEANQKAGKIPSNTVNVVREGRKVLFQAWPYANVLNSVWEFLERQGVRWVYPDEQGDFVPVGKGVNLGILPLAYAPPSDYRYANFSLAAFGQNPNSDQYLYWLRSRWNASWNTPAMLEGKEIPPKDPAKHPKVKGFEGYPHNFATVVPEDVLVQHPDWCGMYRGIMNKDIKPDSPKFGKRLSPGQGGPTFCLSNTNLIEWVAKKAIDSVNGNPDAEGLLWLLPMDSARYCECENCMKLIEPVEYDNMIFEFGGWPSVTEVYCYFVAEVAKRLEKTLPKVQVGAFNYSTNHRPPRNLDRLPDNVLLHIGLYGVMTLPLSHPKNTEMRERLERWSRLSSHLGYYSWELIHSEAENKTPVPLVAAMADRISTLNRIHALSGGTQASENLMAFNPWNFYAFPHLVWKPDTPVETILNDFFSSFYRESSEPMLAYYKTLENQVLKEGVDMRMASYGYGPKPEAFTPAVLKTMDECLARAEKMAVSWVTKERLKAAREGYDWTAMQVARQTAGPEDAVKSGKAIYPCHRRAADITIDGKLDDEAWKACPPATGFTVPKTYRPAVVRQTEFRMAWDDDNLYVGVRCDEPETSNMKTAEGELYFSDSIEVFFAPSKGNPTPYYRLALAPSGRYEGPTCYLASMHNPQRTEPVPCRTAAAIDGSSWSVEAAIPFKALGGAPKPGTAWYGNVCRNVRVAGALAENCTTWTRLPQLNWHFYDEYNSIAFQNDALTAGKAKAIDEKMNGSFRSRHADLLKHYKQGDTIMQRVKGARNLVVNPAGTPASNCVHATVSSGLFRPHLLTAESKEWYWLIYNNSPQCSEVVWPKPVTLNTVVVRFSGQYLLTTAYGIDYFDGQSWHSIAEEKDNVFPVCVSSFAPVQAERLRLYVYQPFSGYRMIDRVEAYQLEQ